MSILFDLLAYAIGMVISAYVGPIGMLCIIKTLELGIKGALFVILGATLANSFYGLIAALGFTTISNIMISNTKVLKLIGGIFLLYLVYKEVKNNTIGNDEAHIEDNNETRIDKKSMLKLTGEVFFLTITYPTTILSFLEIFAFINNEASSKLELIIIVIGALFVSMVLWYIPSLVVTKIKHKLPVIWLKRIKWVSCFILIRVGLGAILSDLEYFFDQWLGCAFSALL